MSTNNKIYLIKTNIILELLKTYLENKDLSWEDPDFEANFKNVTLHPLVEQDILIIKQQFLDCQNVNQLGDENIASSCLPFNEKRLSGCEEFIAAFDRLKNLLEEAIFKPTSSCSNSQNSQNSQFSDFSENLEAEGVSAEVAELEHKTQAKNQPDARSKIEKLKAERLSKGESEEPWSDPEMDESLREPLEFSKDSESASKKSGLTEPVLAEKPKVLDKPDLQLSVAIAYKPLKRPAEIFNATENNSKKDRYEKEATRKSTSVSEESKKKAEIPPSEKHPQMKIIREFSKHSSTYLRNLGFSLGCCLIKDKYLVLSSSGSKEIFFFHMDNTRNQQKIQYIPHLIKPTAVVTDDQHKFWVLDNFRILQVSIETCKISRYRNEGDRSGFWLTYDKSISCSDMKRKPAYGLAYQAHNNYLVTCVKDSRYHYQKLVVFNANSGDYIFDVEIPNQRLRPSYCFMASLPRLAVDQFDHEFLEGDVVLSEMKHGEIFIVNVDSKSCLLHKDEFEKYQKKKPLNPSTASRQAEKDSGYTAARDLKIDQITKFTIDQNNWLIVYDRTQEELFIVNSQQQVVATLALFSDEKLKNKHHISDLTFIKFEDATGTFICIDKLGQIGLFELLGSGYSLKSKLLSSQPEKKSSKKSTTHAAPPQKIKAKLIKLIDNSNRNLTAPSAACYINKNCYETASASATSHGGSIADSIFGLQQTATESLVESELDSSGGTKRVLINLNIIFITDVNKCIIYSLNNNKLFQVSHKQMKLVHSPIFINNKIYFLDLKSQKIHNFDLNENTSSGVKYNQKTCIDLKLSSGNFQASDFNLQTSSLLAIQSNQTDSNLLIYQPSTLKFYSINLSSNEKSYLPNLGFSGQPNLEIQNPQNLRHRLILNNFDENLRFYAVENNKIFSLEAQTDQNLKLFFDPQLEIQPDKIKIEDKTPETGSMSDSMADDGEQISSEEITLPQHKSYPKFQQLAGICFNKHGQMIVADKADHSLSIFDKNYTFLGQVEIPAGKRYNFGALSYNPEHDVYVVTDVSRYDNKCLIFEIQGI